MNNIIITGGSGLVGNAFKKILPNAEYPNKINLTNKTYADMFYTQMKDKYVIHVAAKVGGVKANTEFISDFYIENSTINKRLLEAARIGKAKKVISLLSTCIYPDEKYVNYPLTEEQLHLGPPHESNYGYAYAKRMLDVMSRAYRQQYGCNFITVIPNNLYGENDNFDLENSHVIPALIRKIWEAKINNKSHFEVWGDGEVYREFTYSEDIAKAILFCLENYNDENPINIGNTNEHKLKDIIHLLCDILDYNGEIIFDESKPKGQFRKPTSNQKFLDLGWRKEWYTSTEIGLEKTCKWFIENYPNVRGIAK